MQRLRTQKIIRVVFIAGWALYLAAFAQLQSDVQSKPSTTRAASAHIDFSRDIRPILSDKCFVCHGPDAANNKSKLRFDTEAHAFADLGSGRHAIVRGDPSHSQLVQRITADNRSLLMPPAYSGLKLTKQEIERLTDWIAQGAQWQQHWSFVAPQRPEAPKVNAGA